MLGKKQATDKKQSADIIKVILDDHKPLKEFIKILKDVTKRESERRAAFKDFASQLLVHAKVEQQVLYNFLKSESSMREMGLEGDEEHAIAEHLVKDAEQASSGEIWTAKVKILAQLVEQHIKEEEDHLLPEFKRKSETDERGYLGDEYLEQKTKVDVDEELKAPLREHKDETHAAH